MSKYLPISAFNSKQTVRIYGARLPTQANRMNEFLLYSFFSISFHHSLPSFNAFSHRRTVIEYVLDFRERIRSEIFELHFNFYCSVQSASHRKQELYLIRCCLFIIASDAVAIWISICLSAETVTNESLNNNREKKNMRESHRFDWEGTQPFPSGNAPNGDCKWSACVCVAGRSFMNGFINDVNTAHVTTPESFQWTKPFFKLMIWSTSCRRTSVAPRAHSQPTTIQRIPARTHMNACKNFWFLWKSKQIEFKLEMASEKCVWYWRQIWHPIFHRENCERKWYE